MCQNDNVISYYKWSNYKFKPTFIFFIKMASCKKKMWADNNGANCKWANDKPQYKMPGNYYHTLTGPQVCYVSLYSGWCTLSKVLSQHNGRKEVSVKQVDKLGSIDKVYVHVPQISVQGMGKFLMKAATCYHKTGGYVAQFIKYLVPRCKLRFPGKSLRRSDSPTSWKSTSFYINWLRKWLCLVFYPIFP